jgi:hypothetical protein
VVPPAAAQDPDMNELALEWLQGDWAAPLVCEIGGRPTRGVRRLRVAPDKRRSRERYARMSFFDLAAPGATRCVGELGSEEPELRGNVVFRLDAPSRPDTAMRDFKQELRREGGFEYKIDSGKLQLRRVGDAESAARVIDFAGGTLRASRVTPGTDAARLLAEFPQPRKVTFELRARDGTRLRFHAVAH